MSAIHDVNEARMRAEREAAEVRGQATSWRRLAEQLETEEQKTRYVLRRLIDEADRVALPLADTGPDAVSKYPWLLRETELAKQHLDGRSAPERGEHRG